MNVIGDSSEIVQDFRFFIRINDSPQIVRSVLLLLSLPPTRQTTARDYFVCCPRPIFFQLKKFYTLPNWWMVSVEWYYAGVNHRRLYPKLFFGAGLVLAWQDRKGGCEFPSRWPGTLPLQVWALTLFPYILEPCTSKVARNWIQAHSCYSGGHGMSVGVHLFESLWTWP